MLSSILNKKNAVLLFILRGFYFESSSHRPYLQMGCDVAILRLISFFSLFFLRESFFVPSVSSNHTLFKAAKSGVFAPNHTLFKAAKSWQVQQATYRFSSIQEKADA